MAASSDNPEPGQMVAYRFDPTVAAATEPIREILPIPTPGPDEVLVKILAGGVCHTDVHLFHPGGLDNNGFTKPFTLGHEGAGIVASLGPSVAENYPELKEGTYVAIFGANACFQPTCKVCSVGRNNLCYAIGWIGLGVDGSWAGYCVIRAICLVPVPRDITSIPPAVVAVSTDAIVTPFQALKNAARVQAGQTILVIGCGGLGQSAIQLAKNVFDVGCILACDKRESALQLALEAGADQIFSPEDLVAAVQDKHIDTVLDFVGAQETFDAAKTVVAMAGTIVMVGLAAFSLDMPLLAATTKELTVKFSMWGTKESLKEVLDIIAEGKVKPLYETRPLDDCAQVLKGLHEGAFKGRVALIP